VPTAWLATSPPTFDAKQVRVKNLSWDLMPWDGLNRFSMQGSERNSVTSQCDLYVFSSSGKDVAACSSVPLQCDAFGPNITLSNWKLRVSLPVYIMAVQSVIGRLGSRSLLCLLLYHCKKRMQQERCAHTC
jgi:hypothetical protein